jgi:replicative DNA helicase
VTEPQRDPIRIPTPLSLADAQVRDAIVETERPPGDYPHLPWPAAMRLVGPLLPGQLWTIGARPGQGKTTVLLNLLHDLVQQRRPVLYMTTETRAEELRRVWAAMTLGLDVDAVLENRWRDLPTDAPAQLREHLEWQALSVADLACFVDLPQLSVDHVARTLRDYAKAAGYSIVLLDHIHRWQVQELSQKTAGMTAAVQWLKGMAAKYGFVVLLAAQLNRPDRNALGSEFLPAPLSALKQTGALEEESNVVLMLHRARSKEATAAMAKEVAAGQRDVRDLIEPGIMCAAVAKHRTRPGATGRMLRLRVSRCCRLEDDSVGQAREPGEELPF